MRQPIFQTLVLIAIIAFAACQKNEAPPPSSQDTPFEFFFDNAYSDIQFKYAAWLSDAEGHILAFRWLRGKDTTRLLVPDWPDATTRPDLSVAKIQINDGSAANDTAVFVQTFAGVKNGSTMRLRDFEYRRSTNLSVTFTNINSLDSIIVPDGLTFARPGWWNNYVGLYRVLHSGSFWLRLRVNGDPHWHFMTFQNVESENLNISVDPTFLPTENDPKTVQLPYTAPWAYRIEGVLDADKLKLAPLGDLERAPGGATPVFDKLQVFEPTPFDPLAPPVIPYTRYRLRVAGTNGDGKGFFYDNLHNQLPPALPLPDFDVKPSVVGDNRLAALHCIGAFQAVVLRRESSGKPKVHWDAWAKPASMITHRLPDVPDDLGKLFPDLKNYNFGQAVRARAEGYAKHTTYDAVLEAIFGADNVLWQARGGYEAVEIPL